MLTNRQPGGPGGGPPDFPFTRLSLDGGYLHVFDADVEGGGSFSRNRAAVNFGGTTVFNETQSLRFGVGYRWDGYDFAGNTFVGPDPWDNVNQLNLAGIYGHQLDEDWSLFAGPLIQFAFESGANIADGIQWGALGGATRPSGFRTLPEPGPPATRCREPTGHRESRRSAAPPSLRRQVPG